MISWWPYLVIAPCVCSHSMNFNFIFIWFIWTTHRSFTDRLMNISHKIDKSCKFQSDYVALHSFQELGYTKLPGNETICTWDSFDKINTLRKLITAHARICQARGIRSFKKRLRVGSFTVYGRFLARICCNVGQTLCQQSKVWLRKTTLASRI